MPAFSLHEALHGDEARFLGPLLGGADDPRILADYQAWLLARGDPRGELLQLQAALLADPPPPDSDVRMARLRDLLPACDPLWWGLVERLGHLRNCGAAGDPDPAVRFAFECPNRWESLTPTADPRVRSCDHCRQHVHRCSTRAEAETHARAGRCITVPARLVRAVAGDLTRHITGRPDPLALWARAIFRGDDR
jgi:hypothetical protein